MIVLVACFYSLESGYGGSCFPEDGLQALIDATQRKLAHNFQILKAVEDVNELQKLHLIPKIDKVFSIIDLKGKHFALWGFGLQA
jgi:UDPglucose 6-dehydrogenase